MKPVTKTTGASPTSQGEKEPDRRNFLPHWGHERSGKLSDSNPQAGHRCAAAIGGLHHGECGSATNWGNETNPDKYALNGTTGATL
jgi:hypothetical protein